MKTEAKQSAIRSLANRSKLWIGLERTSQGIFMWVSDGGVLTSQQVVDVFQNANNWDRNGDCVKYGYWRKLAVTDCKEEYETIICEKDMPA